jgi:hypothetical protein
MSKFYLDLNQEQILSKYLDNIYKEKNINFQRVFDLDKQYQGIDVIMLIKFNEYYIDEKSQLHYINKDLPTFTFELSYLKNNNYKKGWLFDESKLTQYYFLITGILLKKGKIEFTSPDDIEKLKITSVSRKKLIKYLSLKELDEKRLLEYDVKLRKEKAYGKNNISELNPKTEGLIYFTEHLSEKPINLQLRLKFLLETKVAKKFYYV